MFSENVLIYYAPSAGIIALLFAMYLASSIGKAEEGNDKI